MPDDSNRRDVLKATAAVGVGFVAAPALAQSGGRAAPNPQTRYPSTPFPEQHQKWPALQRDMTPVPDCGETSYRGSGRLQGRKALITGGDSGIGRAAAIAFAREGAHVAINYFPTEEPDAQDLAKVLRGEGRKIVLLPGDLTDTKFCQGLVDKAASALGGLDILVNNAAYQQSKESIADISFEQFDRTMKTNIYAMFHLSKAAIALFKPGAAIINTASVNSVNPGEELLDYATTKGAILILPKGWPSKSPSKASASMPWAPGRCGHRCRSLAGSCPVNWVNSGRTRRSGALVSPPNSPRST